MKIVYTLQDELAGDPQHVADVQALTLDRDRPFLGLKGTHGLFGSDEWWDNIRAGRIKTEVVTGTITELYFAGQDSRWGDEVNSFTLQLADGSIVRESIYARQKSDQRRFVVGAVVRIAYVFDELKRQPAADGTTAYANTVLEMAVG